MINSPSFSNQIVNQISNQTRNSISNCNPNLNYDLNHNHNLYKYADNDELDTIVEINTKCKGLTKNKSSLIEFRFDYLHSDRKFSN